jgi:glycosyltransferase involved in cell wall biosynthesis
MTAAAMAIPVRRMVERRPDLRVLQVDPSLFTAPYDAALGAGLAGAGVRVDWATRALRSGEEADLPDPVVTCYRRSDGPRRSRTRLNRLIKGVEHLADLRRIERTARDGAYDLVHFQWAIMPTFDIPAMRRIARERPVVLTVHDVTPFNGAGVSVLQRRGFDALFGIADHLIVHTEGARDTLVARGAWGPAISVIPHGPLPLRARPRAVDRPPGRWRVVLFGRLQSYKGIDVLVEALGLLPDAIRARIEVVVAGEAMIDLAPIARRAAELGLDAPVLRLIARRLNEQDMADLLGSADCFVFPYRAIEASGVLFLVAGLGRWLIASDLGAFADTIGRDGTLGRLVAPGEPAELAEALAQAIGRKPDRAALVPDWDTIGARTSALYRQVIVRRKVEA